MPELPDVQSFKRYFECKFLGKKITGLKVTNEKILGNISESKLKERLIGSKFKSAYRYGKYLFIETNNKSFLVFHFGMTGSLKYFENQNEVPSYSRLILAFSNNSHLAFKCIRMLGRIYLTDSMEDFIGNKNLGPDAIYIKKSEFFKSVRRRKGRIKPILLDQSFVAGIGNIYADEILFQSGIHPEIKVNLMDRKKLGKVYNNMKKVLATAVKLNAEIEKHPDFYLSRNRSKFSSCPVCNTMIERINISGRGTYFCPSCQKRMIS